MFSRSTRGTAIFLLLRYKTLLGTNSTTILNHAQNSANVLSKCIRCSRPYQIRLQKVFQEMDST